MRLMKKCLSLIITAAMLAAFAANPAVVFAGETPYIFTDGFEACEIMQSEDTAATLTVGNWTKSSVYRASGFRGRYMSTQIIADPQNADNKVMMLGGYGANNQSCMNLIADTTGAKNNMLFSVDAYIPGKSSDATYGVRLMTSAEETSFYEFYIPKSSSIFTFRKVVSGVEYFSKQVSGMPNIEAGKWFNLEVKLISGTYEFAVTCDGTKYTDSYTDPSPFTLKISDAKVQLGILGDSKICYDNVVYKEFDIYAEGGQPVNMLFYNEASKTAPVYENGSTAAELETAASVKKLALYSQSSLIGTSVYGSNDRSFADETLLGTVTADDVTDYGAMLINRLTNEKFKYIKITGDLTDMRLFREVASNESFVFNLGQKISFMSRFSGVDNAGSWSVDGGAAAVDGGVLTALKKGPAVLTVTDGAVTFTANITVRGEMEGAEADGKTEEYLDSKKSVLAAVNDAIRTKDAAAMETALINEMPHILDFDSGTVTGLSHEKLTLAAQNLVTHKTFGTDTVTTADIKDLISAIEQTTALVAICNEDVSGIENIIQKYSAVYGVDPALRYYADNKAEVAAALANRGFTSIAQIKLEIEKAYTFSAFKKAATAAQLRSVIGDNIAVIGCDRDKYTENTASTSDLFYSLSDNRTGITTIEELKSFIDAYSAPQRSAAENKFAFADSCNSYELVENPSNTSLQYIGTNWKASQIWFGSGWQNRYMGSAVAENPANPGVHDYTIGVHGYGATNYACVNLTADRTGISSDSYTKTDMYMYKFSGVRAGIHTAVSADEKSFYELATASSSDQIVFRKVKNGEEVYSTPLTEKAAAGSWMTFSVGISGKNIIYSVKVGSKTETGIYEDADPLVFSGNDSTMQLMVYGDSDWALFDNIEYRDFDVYTESQKLPKSVLYFDAAYNSAPASQNGGLLYSLGKTEIIRQINLKSESESFPLGVKVYLANEADLSDKIEIGESGTANVSGNKMQLVNRKSADGYRYMFISAAGITANALVRTDPADKITVTAGDRVQLAAIVDYDEQNISWKTSNAAAAAAEDGVLSAYSEGSAVITALSKSGASRSITVNVEGEISKAVAEGKQAQYIAEKKPVVDAVNAAIKSGDSGAIEAILLGSISLIHDFNNTVISKITSADLTLAAKRIVSYQPFCAADGSFTVDDVRSLISAFTNESVVAAMSSRADADAIKSAIDSYSSYYGIDITNKYFLANGQETYTALAGKTFSSAAQIKDAFEKAYTWSAFDKNSVVLVYRTIIEDNAAAIGYDASKYAKISDKSTLCDSLVKNKQAITDIDKLKSFIDGFVEPTSGGSGGGGAGGGGGGFSGGGSSVSASGSAALIAQSAVKEEKSPYTDLPSTHWAYTSICTLAAAKILNGYSDGSFAPENSISRAEFIKMLVEAMGYEHTTEADGFEDVFETDWYCEYMLTAQANGILNGSGGKCCPNDTITREEMASIVFRAMKNSGKITDDAQNGAVTVFGDDSEISDWAFASIKQLQTRGIVNGMPDGKFMPRGSVTRAQAAKIICSAIN